ncbi:MAG TPA: hypothetical protein VH478_23925 [Trebonia sp.]|nr:hypothetical protein [Trebonia sp.]
MNRFHGAIQREAPHRFPAEVAAGAGFAVATIAVLAARARPSAGGGA